MSHYFNSELYNDDKTRRKGRPLHNVDIIAFDDEWPTENDGATFNFIHWRKFTFPFVRVLDFELALEEKLAARRLVSAQEKIVINV